MSSVEVGQLRDWKQKPMYQSSKETSNNPLIIKYVTTPLHLCQETEIMGISYASFAKGCCTYVFPEKSVGNIC